MSTPADTSDPDLWGLSREEHTAMLIEQEQVVRREQAKALKIVAAMDRQDAGKGYGVGVTEKVLEDVLRITPTEASRRVKRARSFCGSLGMTGEPIEPKLSKIAEGMRHGDYDSSQLDAMNSILTKLPPHVD